MPETPKTESPLHQNHEHWLEDWSNDIAVLADSMFQGMFEITDEQMKKASKATPEEKRAWLLLVDHIKQVLQRAWGHNMEQSAYAEIIPPKELL